MLAEARLLRGPAPPGTGTFPTHPGSSPMAERRASLMEPRMEHLLDRVDSKFTLVTLAAMRAREINDYYNQLGEGLGKIVPPQVTSVSRKPLTISLEEIEAGKIEAVPLPEEATSRRRGQAAEAARRRRSARREEPRPPRAAAPPRGPIPRHRCRPAMSAPPTYPTTSSRSAAAGSCSASPAGSPRTRRSRCAAGSSTPARTSPGPHRGRAALRRRAHVLGARVGARPHLAVRPGDRRADPAHAARPGADLVRRRAGDGEAHRQVRRRDLRRPAHRDAARDARAGAGRARDAHRDVGAPCGAGEPRDAAAPRRARRRSRVGPPRRRRRRRGPPRRTRRDRRRGRRACSPRRRPRRAARARDRRRDPRADRPGALHREPVVREDGLRGRRRRRPPRRRGDAR